MRTRLTLLVMALFIASAGSGVGRAEVGGNVAATDFDEAIEAQLRQNAFLLYVHTRDPISARHFVEPACRYEVETADAILKVLGIGLRVESLRRDMIASGHPTHFLDFIVTDARIQANWPIFDSENILQAVDKVCRDATGRIIREFEAEHRTP